MFLSGMMVLRRPSVLVIGSGSVANTLASLLTALDCGVASRPEPGNVLPERHDVVFVDLASAPEGWHFARRAHRTREQGTVILLHRGVATIPDSDRAERLGARLLPTPVTLQDFRILIERVFPPAEAWRVPARVG
jgi:hypothetical protein